MAGAGGAAPTSVRASEPCRCAARAKGAMGELGKFFIVRIEVYIDASGQAVFISAICNGGIASCPPHVWRCAAQFMKHVLDPKVSLNNLAALNYLLRVNVVNLAC